MIAIAEFDWGWLSVGGLSASLILMCSAYGIFTVHELRNRGGWEGLLRRALGGKKSHWDEHGFPGVRPFMGALIGMLAIFGLLLMAWLLPNPCQP